jgi:hypothetical protein
MWNLPKLDFLFWWALLGIVLTVIGGSSAILWAAVFLMQHVRFI